MQLKVIIALVFATLAAAAPAEVIARKNSNGVEVRVDICAENLLLCRH